MSKQSLINPDELDIYSYLMRESIPFSRYYHETYKNKKEWKRQFKNKSFDIIFPSCKIYYNSVSKNYVIFLCIDDTENLDLDGLVPADFSAEDTVKEILHCKIEISILGLIFDEKNLVNVILSDKLADTTELVALSPCSSESTIVMRFDSIAKFLDSVKK